MAQKTTTAVVRVGVASMMLVVLAGCGNTIRGVGHDVGNVVDATQDAGRSVANSVR